MLLVKDMHGNVWDCSDKPGLESWLIANFQAKHIEPLGLTPEEAHEWRIDNSLPCDCEECIPAVIEETVQDTSDDDVEE